MPDTTTPAGGFQEYRRLILTQLADLSAEIKGLRIQVNKMERDMASLQTQAKLQSAFYGILGGTVAAIGAVLLQFLG